MTNDSLTYSLPIKYSNDLTSHQIWKILIGLLLEAARPLCLISGDFIFDLLGSVCRLSISSRRKASSADSPDMLPWVSTKLVELSYQNTPEHRVAVYDELLQKGIERNIVVDHIVMTVRHLKDTTPFDPFKLDKHIQTFLNMYETFRKDVFNRYYDLTVVAANKNHYLKKQSGLNTTKLDMLNIYTISAYRAIDKFAPFKGTLTSYIQTWFQFAEGGSAFSMYDNEAVTINRDVRRKIRDGDLQLKTQAINFELVATTLKIDNHSEENMYLDAVSGQIDMLEYVPLLFVIFGLKYNLTEEDLELIEEHNEKMK